MPPSGVATPVRLVRETVPAVQGVGGTAGSLQKAPAGRKAGKVVRLLDAAHRWAVSGTPMDHGRADDGAEQDHQDPKTVRLFFSHCYLLNA